MYSQRSINYSKYEPREDDMEPKLFEKKCKELLSEVQLSKEKIHSLERETVNQGENQQWILERKKRLTASNFGSVFRWNDNKCRCRLIEEITSPSPTKAQVRAVKYGRENEGKAIAAYKRSTNQRVDRCGLFVHPEFGFLGASPDGLINHDGILEVKCIYSDGDPIITPLEAAKRRGFYCTLSNDGKQMNLKTNHNHYYQIQGQLEITGREYCDFVVWSPRDMHVERIKRNKKLWEEMFPTLEAFYKLFLLPELVDPRRNNRHSSIRVLDFCD